MLLAHLRAQGGCTGTLALALCCQEQSRVSGFWGNAVTLVWIPNTRFPGAPQMQRNKL